MKIVIYGLTLTSSWGNGHATTYRALCRALAELGHEIHFVERDVEWYRNHRDLPSPDFAHLHLYQGWSDRLLIPSRDADIIVVGSYFPDAVAASSGLFDAGYGPVVFYDIDTPVTLEALRVHGRISYLDPEHIPRYAAYLSFSGGSALQILERDYHSPWAIGFYCSVDAERYRPSPPKDCYCCDLSYLGTYALDRQPKLMELMNGAACRLPNARFVVAGPQYPDNLHWHNNVARIDHVPPPEHPAFYSSSQFTLNITRGDMLAAGYSPSVRLFEAAACGTVILSDTWAGLETFFIPGEEILLPRDDYEVADILRSMSLSERARMGRAARARVLEEHTARRRAAEFEAIASRVSSGSYVLAPQRQLR